MKQILLKSLSIFIMAAMCVGFTSCGDDDGDSGGDNAANNEVVKRLMAKGWKLSSGDYNEYSYGAAAETSIDYLYFLDGQHGVNVWSTKEIDSHFGTSNDYGKNFFNYSVQGNRIIINYFNGNTQILTFKESYLDSGGNTYLGFGITSDDQNRISTWRRELTEAIDATGYGVAVKSGVLATIRRTDKFHQQLDITSNLAQKYPYKTIKYIMITDGDDYKEYSFKDNNNLHVDNILCTNANFSIFLGIYDSIMKKQNSGQSLTSAEREELSSVTKILNDIANNISFEFFVEINGQRFSIPTKYI
ncbi:MAG: hypothetical protein J6I54_06015 [Bacteroidaceae bacterium]|nr:hypothetical protein [Bacteroidaceae bacterium]MBR1467499.1 hypothetical protein [Bacteroidaceae bacterium]